MKDVVIVGGGIAGLAAAWRLRHWDIALLEADHRVGGRIKSERRGAYWLNWGAHVYAGPGSETDSLLSEVGVGAANVRGSLKLRKGGKGNEEASAKKWIAANKAVTDAWLSPAS